MPQIRFAVLCASNQNRSMEAHNVLKAAGFNIRSFGTGTSVRLPGPSQDKPNVYSFGTPYEVILKDLLSKNKQLYQQNGLLTMLERNLKVKKAPERFQENEDTFDVIFTCEERCFDAACDSILNRPKRCNQAVHVINIEIADNHEQAAIGARHILNIARQIESLEDLDQGLEKSLENYMAATNISVLHTVSYF